MRARRHGSRGWLGRLRPMGLLFGIRVDGAGINREALTQIGTVAAW